MRWSNKSVGRFQSVEHKKTASTVTISDFSQAQQNGAHFIEHFSVPDTFLLAFKQGHNHEHGINISSAGL